MTSKNTLPKKEKNFFQKSINKLNGFFHSKGKTESPQNRTVLISTFFLILIGIYFFSVFHGDFEQFNAERRASTLGLTFIIIATALFIYRALFFLYTGYNYINVSKFKMVCGPNG